MFLYQIYVQCSTSCYFLFPYFDRCNCFFLYSNKLLQSQWSKQNDYFSLFVFLSRNPAKHDARATKREDWTTMCMCWCMPHLTLCQLCSFIKYKVFICTGMRGKRAGRPTTWGIGLQMHCFSYFPFLLILTEIFIFFKYLFIY